MYFAYRWLWFSKPHNLVKAMVLVNGRAENWNRYLHLELQSWSLNEHSSQLAEYARVGIEHAVVLSKGHNRWSKEECPCFMKQTLFNLYLWKQPSLSHSQFKIFNEMLNNTLLALNSQLALNSSLKGYLKWLLQTKTVSHAIHLCLKLVTMLKSEWSWRVIPICSAS